MSYAQNIFTTTSPNETNFVITWTAPYYMTTADVKAEVDNASAAIDKVAWTVVSVSGTNVTLATGIPTDSTVRIYRETDVSSNEVDFLAGSPFRAGDVNLNFDQTLFAIQEALTSDENHEADIDRLEGLIDTILALLNNNIQFVQVANVAALDTAAATDPENLKGYEVTDSTGLEGANPEIPLLPPKAGTGTGEDPVTGVYWDSGISTKVLWDKANQNWIYVSYFASNGDNRYQQITLQQATAPVLANFKNGTLWFNTTDQNLYVLYDDAGTRSWVLVGPLRDDRYVNKTGDSMTGNLLMNNADVVFEGSTDDGFETTLTVTDPTADNSIVLPNVSGNVVTTGDTGTVTSTMIVDGTIVDADVNSSAAIGLSKLATGALPTGITVASANIVDGTIVDADINASAAITLTKLGSGALPSNITVNSDNITNLSIVNDDVNANAEIEVSKLANGTARQLLQTDAAGTGVEFTSNVDVPGTLDVTGNAVFDGTGTFAGGSTVTGGSEIKVGNGQAAFVVNDGYGKGTLAGSAFVLTNTSGTNTVSFDTSTGSASFAGAASFGAGLEATGLWASKDTKDGYINVTQSTAGAAAFSVIKGDGTASATITGGGSASFAGGAIELSADTTVYAGGFSASNGAALIYGTGAATFAGTITSGSLTTGAAYNFDARSTSYVLRGFNFNLTPGAAGNPSLGNFDRCTAIIRESGTAAFASTVSSGTLLNSSNYAYITPGQLYVNRTNTSSPALIISNSGTQKCTIGASGSASFAGEVSTNNIYVVTAAVDTQACLAVKRNGVNKILFTGNGTATFAGTVSAQGSVLTSDARFKTNITPAGPQLADVVQLGNQLKNWNWTEDAPVADKDTRFLGLIAQELEEVCPTLVTPVERTKQGKELTPEQIIPAVYEDKVVPAEYKTIVIPAKLGPKGNEIAPASTEEVLVTPEYTEQVLVKEEEIIPATYEELDDSYKAIKNDVFIMKLLGAVAELTARVEDLETKLFTSTTPDKSSESKTNEEESDGGSV